MGHGKKSNNRGDEKMRGTGETRAGRDRESKNTTEEEEQAPGS